jgi:thiol-disulfide isomerase/thioredoxin
MNTILKSLLPLLFLSLSFCMDQGHTAKRVPDGDTVILVGTASLDSLNNAPFSDWYEPALAAADPDPQKIEALTPLMEGVEIVLFLGTWCEDSQREVPKFVRILRETGYPEENVTVVSMTRDKTTPQNYEAGLEITNVPTFIFYRNGEEIGRIVEITIEDMESDMLKILRGEPYKHAFDWD